MASPAKHAQQPDVLQQAPVLVQLLKASPQEQSKADQQKEARLLEQLASSFSTTYEFTTLGHDAARLFQDILEALVANRIQKAERRAALREDHLLRVLQVLRLLTRDTVLRRTFVQTGAIKELCDVFSKQAEYHFTGQITPFQVELLTELASIAKRLAVDDWGLAAMVGCDMHSVLTVLLHSTDPAILPLVLVALIGYGAHKEHASLVSGGHVINLLLRIVADYDVPFKRLAADLLALLARRESVISELLELNGLGRLVGQLQAGDSAVTASLLRVVCYMAADSRSMQEFYQTGTVPVLLSMVSAALREASSTHTQTHTAPASASPATTPHTALSLSASRVSDMQLVCTALTRISEDDDLSCAIRGANGVTLLGKLLLVNSAPAAPASDVKESDRPVRDMSGLHAYVLRALRFLFSTERNRKVFKRLFPPDFFAAFIDVGHYNASLSAYQPLVARLHDLNDKARAALSSALDDISADSHTLQGGDGTQPLRTVRNGQYILLDILGKGAYGAVYKARRVRGDTLVALKEVPLTDVSLFGATPSEREAGVGVLNKEVDILSSLSHPHIVQYYESFTEDQHLYIAMELVEGVSLLDYINSLAEKGRRMPEEDIWQVLLAVSQALHYIHTVAKVVHRDLTPANIVLGPGTDGLKHAKIADFGLAKRVQGQVITAQSLVGTMPYTCPEIIQQEQYSVKADVWSLGCVLYHCIMLRPPFDGSNPLSVASKIVEGSYVSVPESEAGATYSQEVRQLQKLLMTVNPSKRPSMEDVAALLSGRLMSALERLTASEQRLQRALTLERAHQRRAASAGFMLPAVPDTPFALPSPWPFAHTQSPHVLSSPLSGGSIRQHNSTMAGALRSRRPVLNPLQTALSAGGGVNGANTPTHAHNTNLIPAYSAGNAAHTAAGSPVPATPAAVSRAGSDAHAALGAAGSWSTPHAPASAGVASDRGGEAGCSPATGEASTSVGVVSAWEPGSGSAQGGQGGGGGGGVGAGGFAAGHWGSNPGTPGRMVNLATSRLRPVHDPLTQILSQLHKIMWVEQQPPGLTRDSRRRCVEAFRRVLFGPGTGAATIKAHLAKLQAGENDVIRDASGRPVEFGTAALGAEGSGQTVTPVDGCLTYEQLAQVVESFLSDKGYWAQQQHLHGSLSHPYSPMHSTLGGRQSGTGGGATLSRTPTAGAALQSMVSNSGTPDTGGGGGGGEVPLHEQLPPSSFGVQAAATPQSGGPASGGLPRRLSSLRH